MTLLALPLLIGLTLLAAAALLPAPGFAAYAVLAVAGLLFTVVWPISAMVLTWRRSAHVSTPRGWARWYGLLAIFVAVNAAAQLLVVAVHHYYKPWYIPSGAMIPTLLVGDHLLGNMHDQSQLQRGDMVIVNASYGPAIKRVVAIAGDRVALQGGIPVIDGVRSVQRPAGAMPADLGGRPVTGRIAQETLPGERGSHAVLDLAVVPQDDFTETTVPSGHVFVLGDNRDNSEDSRFPANVGGLGMLPLTKVVGRPLFIYWSSDRARVGRRLSR